MNGAPAQVALKIIELSSMSPKERQSCLNEASILMALNHSNVLKCYDAFIEDDKLCVVLEYANRYGFVSLIHFCCVFRYFRPSLE